MSKGAKTTAGPEARTTVVSSAAVQFSVDYQQARQLPIGKAVYSDVVSAGAHLWRIECSPQWRQGEVLLYLYHAHEQNRRSRHRQLGGLPDGDGQGRHDIQNGHTKET